MKVKWIFFDVGSTLVDEALAYDHRAMDMLKETNITFEEFNSKRRELSELGYDGNSSAISFFDLTKTPWHTEDEVIFSDAPSVLNELKNDGFNLGIIANQQPGLEERLDKWKILNYFSIIISSSDIGLSKPDKRIFQEAISRSKCAPQECLMIGDRLDNDVIPASEIGMKTIWIKHNDILLPSDHIGYTYADFIVDNLSKICDILKQER